MKEYTFINTILTACAAADAIEHSDSMVAPYALCRAAISEWKTYLDQRFALRNNNLEQHTCWVESVNSLCNEVTRYCEDHDFDCEEFITTIRSWQ
jgi:hypothetical protein